MDLQARAAKVRPSLGAVFSVRQAWGGGSDEIPICGGSRQKKENQTNWVKLDPEIKCYLRACHAPPISRIVQIVQSSRTF